MSSSRSASPASSNKSKAKPATSDGLSPTDTFNAIQRTAHELVATQYALWKDELTPLLAKNGIRFHDVAQLNAKRAAWARRYFQEEVFPLLTPLAVDASHPFPQLLNKSHNLLVRARAERGGEPLHAIVQVPRALPRLILMPRGKGEDEPWDYIYLASLIKHQIADLFPGLLLDGVHAFRVTRNSDLYIDEEEAENLLRSIEQELRRSSRGDAVRLEVEADCPKDFRGLLLEFFDLAEPDLYKLDGPISMTHLAPLVANDAFAKLKDRVFQPARDPALPPQADLFDVMRKQDVLLHHPYESFDPIVELIENAAQDPQVLAIKITLYRTSGDSSIVEALIHAASAGKQVTALVELRARFDEAANIQWAKRLEEAGARRLWRGWFEDALQSAAHRPARCRPAPALCASRHRKLPPADRAHLHRFHCLLPTRKSDENHRGSRIVFNIITGYSRPPRFHPHGDLRRRGRADERSRDQPDPTARVKTRRPAKPDA